MSTPGPSLHASILSRLKNISRERREDMQFTLARYTCERLLYRLSRSQHADSFVLKGAALFGLPHFQWTHNHTQGSGVVRDLGG